MIVSFYSLLMAILWSSCGLFILYCCIKRRWFIRRFGIQLLTFLYMLCVLRLLFPVEMPNVRTIKCTGIFASVYQILGLEKAKYFGAEISVLQLCAGIWGIGAVFSLLKWICGYLQGKKCLQKILKYSDKAEEMIMEQIKEETEKFFPVQIWRNPYIDIPVGFGIFQKVILLPKEPYSSEQLYFILRHEYTHFKNHDLEIKMLLQLFCCIFWWNPCAHLLLRELDQILEIRCDLTVVKGMEKNQKSIYLQTILQVLQNGIKNIKNSKIVFPSAMLVQQGNMQRILERFQIVKETEEKKAIKMKRLGIIALICSIFSGSYMFQFQATYFPPKIEDELTSKNTYLIDNKNGTYTIVDMDGEKLVLPKNHIMIKSMIEQGFEEK